ncbi:MAG TPA: sugar phosphate nucleotidyltransferase [Verrucomicrobiae bacterium]|nr:sugar phosphate nucleotidyltransferase [Verrucomicrobiae bacterium]
MNIETAVIPVAGAGSREFPVTTAIEKCMMPVYAGPESRPLVDYMVEDCVLAGLSRVIFVTSERGEQQLRDYFGQDISPTIRQQLLRVGKTDKIDQEIERRRAYGIEFEYVIQPPDNYGTAIPPFLARERLQGEKHFALMGGDDFVYHQNGTSELSLAIADWKEKGTEHAIMGLPVDREQATKYGNLLVDQYGNLGAFDEKPPLERIAEHPVANISRYLLSGSIWEHIDAEMQRNRGLAEHYVTFAIQSALAADQSFYVHRVLGKYLDGGSFEGLLEASNYITTHPRFAEWPTPELITASVS